MKAVALTACGATVIGFVLTNLITGDAPAWLDALSTLALVVLLWQLRDVFAVMFFPRRRRR